MPGLNNLRLFTIGGGARGVKGGARGVKGRGERRGEEKSDLSIRRYYLLMLFSSSSV